MGRSAAWLAVAGLACGAAGCGPNLRGAAAPLAKPPEMPGDQARCRVAASHENPLVTEWPAPEKANLEARLREGSVVVAYTGCTLKMLPSCHVRGAYQWRRTTTASDTVEIHDEDELYAKMPLGAATLEGELRRSGRLAVQTTVSGQFKLADFDPSNFPRGADCLGATHVVDALAVGAFKLRSGGAAHIGGDVQVGTFGGGGSASSEETVMREAGEPARCEQSDDAAPQEECASPIQIFLEPLPASVVDRGPPGTVKVKFAPVSPDQDWEVVVGDRTLCKTPCERWLDPGMPYSLKYDPGFLSRNEYLDVPDLRAYAGDERVAVKATPQSKAELAGGILATAFGGMGLAAGIALTAASSSTRTAGIITMPASLLLLIPGIWMILDSKGTVQVTPMAPER